MWSTVVRVNSSSARRPVERKGATLRRIASNCDGSGCILDEKIVGAPERPSERGRRERVRQRDVDVWEVACSCDNSINVSRHCPRIAIACLRDRKPLCGGRT